MYPYKDYRGIIIVGAGVFFDPRLRVFVKCVKTGVGITSIMETHIQFSRLIRPESIPFQSRYPYRRGG